MNRRWKPMAWALCASVLLHLALFYSVPRIDMPELLDTETAAVPISAHLVPASPPARYGVRSATPPRHPPRRTPKPRAPKMVAKRPVVKPSAEPAQPVTEEGTAPTEQGPVKPEATDSAQVAEQPMATEPAPENPKTTDSAEVAEQPNEPQAVQIPEKAELRYVLYKGRDGLMVGRATHIWRAQDGRYSIKSIIEAAGLFSLFYSGRLIQTSEGMITQHGLRPDEFVIQRGKIEKTETASFDWDSMNLTLNYGGSSHVVKLSPEAQDQLSFVHQFAFAPPHAPGAKLAIASSRKFGLYEYRVVGEEDLETELGTLKTLHLSKVRGEDSGGTDIWLAIDHHYLPVKIELVDKKGNLMQQLIAEMNIQ